MKHILYALNGTFFMLLVPALFVLALRQLSHEANQKLVNTFGFNSQIIAGGLGIIVHELSHLIMAIIFGHHINAVSLLRIPSNTNDMSLGYVKHTWSPTSTYQKVGNAFIGIAPVLGCTLLIYIIMRTLNAPISLVQNQLTTQLLSNGNAPNWNFLTHSWIYIFELFQLNFDSIFNSATKEYNNAVQTFPSNIIAGMTGFQREIMFDLGKNERANLEQAPKISF